MWRAMYVPGSLDQYASLPSARHTRASVPVVTRHSLGRPTSPEMRTLPDIEPRAAAIKAELFEFASLEQLNGWDSILGLQFENLILNHVNDLPPYGLVAPHGLVDVVAAGHEDLLHVFAVGTPVAGKHAAKDDQDAVTGR